jgi:hypothetical protein
MEARRAETSSAPFTTARPARATPDSKGKLMGDAKRKRSATQVFIETFPQCCFCGGIRPATTREHMPPKALFDRSHRQDDLVMPSCKECNSQTSTADAVVSILSRWKTSDMSEAEKEDHKKLADGLKRSHPEIVDEWTGMSLLDRLKAKRDYIRDGIDMPGDAGLLRIGQQTIRQLNLFAHKAALGLYFDLFRKLLPNTGRFCAYWRTKEDVLRGGIPIVLLEMMNRYGTLEQGKWRASETFEYRYELNTDEGLFAFVARARGAFYVTGFAVEDAATIGDEDKDSWIAPSALLKMMDDPRFESRG